MRTVLDTNILACAVASPNGPAAEVFERVSADHVLVVSLELLAEVARVLSYDRLRRLHHLSESAIAAFVASIEAGSLIVPLPIPLPRVVPDDSDDDVLVATAVVGHANVLCTRNRHLFHEDVVAYCSRYAIDVLDDVEVLARLRDSQHRSPDR